MFTTNKATRQLINRADVAYIYPDGIAIITRERAKAKGAPEKYVEIAHVFHCPIRFTNNMNPDDLTTRRIVVHDPNMIMHGVRTVDVFYQAGSQNMIDRQIDAASVTLTTPDGGRVRDLNLPFVSAHLTIQPVPVTVDSFGAPYSEVWKKVRSLDEWVRSGDYFAVVDHLPLLVEADVVIAVAKE